MLAMLGTVATVIGLIILISWVIVLWGVTGKIAKEKLEKEKKGRAN